MAVNPTVDGAGSRPWVLGLAAATLLGLVVRLWYLGWHDVPSQPGFLVNFDPIFYHRQANAVADGLGFIAPHLPGRQPSAGHPPLLVVVLAAASRLGLDTFEAHRVVTAVIGTAVVPVVGLLAGRLFGRMACLVAAVVAAVHPQLWINDGLVMPEGLYALLVATALWAGVVAWDRPQRRLAVALGLLVGLAALTRGEGVLLVPFLVAPLALASPSFSDRRERGWFAGLAVLAVVVT
ncbi:MAG TPA: glycosyltransferase family 39 protein, partial [Acidimicrobiales bacterium]|nr:glycosyltransferase family 39 protein [Acidimicrobiales bacterium]